MKTFIKNLFTSSKKKQQLTKIKETLEDALLMLNESKLMGHSCPDYGLKYAYKKKTSQSIVEILADNLEISSELSKLLSDILYHNRAGLQHKDDLFALKNRIEITLKTL